MKHFHPENNNSPEEVDSGQLEALLTLVSEFGRVKFSSQDIAPPWSRRMQAQLQAAGLSDVAGPEQMGLLWQFYRSHRMLGGVSKEGQRMSEVSGRLGIPLSSASRTVDLLVQRGLLSRRSDDHDRRIILVSVTPLGQAVYAIFDDAFRHHLAGLLGQLTPDERGQLLHIGTRVFEIWSRAVKGEAAELT
ncbi:winged helix DNA-binding protein [Deinococcus detaillensis]|uniref:Winged helix DNA-binding protein n=1 Tax=Deinococcus detaillensis TaxID=2592048 RepID=A0A553V571_9DEIO|nr:MarR family transcriptional regulator [Deinococcus detaillensis]TSA87606.1 winged helix DNA-binding protein [Deinococcus detaillensis]